MNLIGLLFTVGVCGFIYQLAYRISMPPSLRSIIVALVAVYMILFLLQAMGVQIPHFPKVRLR